ncbi:hypothetical protein GCM10017781_42110 [Deinococcus metalli]|uniref:Transposase n=1 Tax=Deinococcus metalli TaxID=1141878 RepID=A0ABQ3JWQ0_9DEIO|nr:hypothetical protein GCM10017781_42110 [Deinococcus metalli]
MRPYEQASRSVVSVRTFQDTRERPRATVPSWWVNLETRGIWLREARYAGAVAGYLALVVFLLKR